MYIDDYRTMNEFDFICKQVSRLVSGVQTKAILCENKIIKWEKAKTFDRGDCSQGKI